MSATSQLRRVNFYAGAGAGKSTTAAWLFSELKRRGKSVELVMEYIKAWAYIDRKPRSFDQVYVFGKQLHAEDRILSSGVECVVTDSPLLLSPVYSSLYGGQLIASHLYGIAKAFEEQFPSVNIYLMRGNKPYIQQGRWGSRAEAENVDKMVLEFLRNAGIEPLVVDWDDLDTILNHVLRSLTLQPGPPML